MTTILRAEAQITAEDKTAAAFAAVEKKLEHLASKTKAVSKVSASVGKVADQMASKKMLDGMSNFDAKMASQNMINRLGRFTAEIDRAAAATRKMAEADSAAARKRAEIATKMSSWNAENNTLINRLSRYSQVSDQAASAARRFAEAERQVAAGAQRAADALAKQNLDKYRHTMDRVAEMRHRATELRAEEKGHHGALRTMGSMAAGYVGAHSVLHGVKETAHAGAEIESAKTHMRVAGIPQAEIDAAVSQVTQLQQTIHGVSIASGLDRYKELRSILQDTHEVPEMMPVAMKAQAVLNAQDAAKGGSAGPEMAFYLKAAEVLGRATRPEALTQFMDAALRARQVMGDTITGEDIFTSARQYKALGASFSDRFLNTTGLSITQEMPGGSGANAMFMMAKFLNGDVGHNQDRLKAWLRFSKLSGTPYVTDDDIEYNKNGQIHGLKAGHTIKYGREAAKDPDKFIWDHLAPDLDKIGVKDPAARVGWYSQLFEKSAANAASKLDVQGGAFRNHATLYDTAGGIGAGETFEKGDPFAGLNNLKTAIQNLVGTASSPLMAQAAQGMSLLTASISGMAKLAGDNPKLASDIAVGAAGAGLAGAGTMAYWVATGFGLPPASAKLLAAATALEAAAAKGMPGAVPAAPGAAPGVTPAKPGSSLPWLAPIGTVLTGLFAAQAADAAFDYAEGSPQGKSVDAWVQKSMPQWFSKYVWGNKDTPQWVSNPIGAAVDGAPGVAGHLGKVWNYFVNGYDDPVYHASQLPEGHPLSPSMSPVVADQMAFGNKGGPAPSLGQIGPLSDMPLPPRRPGDFSGNDTPVTAKLEGEGNVTVTVKVEPSGELIRAVETARQASSSGHIKLNTGSDDSGRNGSRDGR